MSDKVERNPYSTATRGLWRTFVIVGLFSAIVNILMLTGPMFMLQVYDRVLSSGSVATLQGLFLIVVGLYAFMALYDFLRARLLSRASYRLDQTVGAVAFAKWVRGGSDPGDKMTRPLSDLGVVRQFLGSPGVLGIFDLPWVPFYLAVVMFIHPWLGWLAIGGAGVVVVMALANQWTTRMHYARAMAMDGTESFFVEQARRNAEAVLPLGMLDRVKNRWSEMHTAGLAIGQVGGDRAEGFTASSKAFRMLLQSALLGLGGYLALQQEITPGMIIAGSIIAGRALAPLDQVIGNWRGIVRTREAHKRLKETLDNQKPANIAMRLPEPKGFVNLVNVYKYPPERLAGGEQPPILQQISFELEPGDALGVIGPSASGKSTLARLLIGSWRPDAGEVRLDGATLDQWQPEELGQFIGYLPQSLELLSGTIRDNICRFDPEAQDEDIIAAARIAGVHEMVLKLAEGYGTRIGYGTPQLSGGQVQRIGLARAVYGMPKLVVLDEPNSNLDASGDEALSQAIATMREAGSTVVVMAHRPSAIAAVTKVLVLKEGRVVHFGPKDEVLRKATRPTPVETPQRKGVVHAS
ncbi:MAG: type I secretion system permease/ATPase [Paracoccaceae bacterium]